MSGSISGAADAELRFETSADTSVNLPAAADQQHCPHEPSLTTAAYRLQYAAPESCSSSSAACITLALHAFSRYAYDRQGGSRCRTRRKVFAAADA